MAKDLRARATSQAAQQNDAPPTLAKQIALMQNEFQRAMPKGMEAAQLVRDAPDVDRGGMRRDVGGGRERDARRTHAFIVPRRPWARRAAS